MPDGVFTPSATFGLAIGRVGTNQRLGADKRSGRGIHPVRNVWPRNRPRWNQPAPWNRQTFRTGFKPRPAQVLLKIISAPHTGFSPSFRHHQYGTHPGATLHFNPSNNNNRRPRVTTPNASQPNLPKKTVGKGTAIAIALAICGPITALKAEPNATAGNAHSMDAIGSVPFDIPAQDLAGALAAFAAQSRVQVLYEGSIARGLRSRGLQGSYPPDQALQILLATTPLQARHTDKKTVTLEPRPTPSGSDAGGGNTLGKVTVSARVIDDPKAYQVTHAATATRTDTPIMDTPLSIQVVPKVVMDDQQVVSLKEGVQNVSGVQWSPVQGNLYENFVIRGFDGANSLARNGIRESALATDLANIDRVEVLKGPASILYGRIEPGGLINRVTKEPLFQPYYALQQQFGSFDLYRTTVDATGPLNDQLAYRVNLAYQSNNSFRDYINNERIFFAPSITWRPTDRTELGLTLEYQHDNMRWDDGLPAIGNKPANVPINLYLGDSVSRDEQDRKLVDFHWSHEFNQDWKINQRFVASLVDYKQFNILPWNLEADNRTLNMYLWDSRQERNTYSQNINVTGHADTWGAQHTILAGFDFYKFDQPGVSPSMSAALPNF
ncbi:MAG: TonB-dependent receptor, partial [Methylococcaceae bacterium]